ncbi:MAG TPA: tetratricopeptide repeat protein [Anaerolineae bacterium]|nr:tetratricopeptide repeat protein [Anaerolineae bacterium]HQI83006.1 tetratricopeptide repeat protein [Anaerolineae bacterium]
MTRLTISLLGPFQATLDGEAIAFATDKVRALLGYLVVEAQHAHRRDTLAGLLWPDHPQNKARQNLRQALSSLRKALHEPETPDNGECAEGAFLTITRDTVQFNAQLEVSVDVTTFDALHEMCKNHRHRRLETCRICLQRLGTMAALYKGEFLEQFFLSDSEPFEEWALFKRERHHIHMVETLTVLAHYAERRGEIAQACEFVQRQVTLEPWREEAHRDLMRLLAREGQRSAALMQYEKCRRVLAKELGVAPTAETETLYALISANRFADTESPQTPYILPVAPTSFVGRGVELDDIAGLLSAPDCRLVTLLGPGGIGKSRLALHIAEAHLGLFAHGVWFVPLATVASLDGLISAIVDTLQIAVHSHQDLASRVLDYARAREMLLILDGFEHVLDEGAPFLTRLLRAAPGVVLLVTSRERLNLQEEWVYELHGLDYPTGTESTPTPSSAMELFFQRARQVNRQLPLTDENVSAVTHICRLVEGMPLAVELAAAWTATRSCADIADAIRHNLDILTTRLRDVPGRHRSIRVAFEHSWQRLSAAEQEFFAQLSVFQGGFTREAVDAVTGAPPTLLADLLDKSLIRRTTSDRYDMHELLRQYTAEKLREHPHAERTANTRHARYFTAFLAERRARLQSVEQRAALAEIAVEIENARRAWLFAVASGWAEAVEGGLESLYDFYDIRCRFQEGIELFAQTPAAWAESPALRGILGKVQARLGAMHRHLDHYQQARALLQEGLRIAEMDGRTAEIVFCLTNLTHIQRLEGEYEAVLREAEHSLALARRGEDRLGIIRSLHLLGMTHTDLGNIAQAEGYLRQSLDEAAQSGNPRLMMAPLNALGDVLCYKGDYTAAQKTFEQCLALSYDLGDSYNIAIHLNNLGTVLHLEGKLTPARGYYQKSLNICREIGDQRGEAIALSNLGEIAYALDMPEEARALYQAGLDIGRRIPDRWTMMICLNNLGEIACRSQTCGEAAAYFTEALKITQATQTLPMALKILVNAATLFAQQGRSERAAALLGIARQHPAGEQATQAQAAQLLAELKLSAPENLPDSLDALIEEVLTELTALSRGDELS